VIRKPLTDDQKRASATREPLVFVESAPGSGKTTVAAERFGVLRYAHHRSDPRGVIAVSFARTAADELRKRIDQRWGSKTTQSPNRATTMDGLHRAVVDFLMRTDRIRWPGTFAKLNVIDSWERQRGAIRVRPGSERNQRWELALNGDELRLDYRTVDASCWGMAYAKRQDYKDQLLDGVCTHDEIRQLVGLALGRPDLRTAIDEFLSRSYAHLIVDEAFDLNGLDAVLVRRAIETGVGVTLVGDPWQALYEWRGARPEEVRELLTDYPFETIPMSRSFRFKTPETVALAARLRSRRPVTLAVGGLGSDVVLASEWDHLLAAGSDIVPLSFGRLECQTDASIVLVLDEVVRVRLGKSALAVREAVRCLRRERDGVDLQPVLAMLRDESVPVEDAVEALRLATKVGGVRRPSLPSGKKQSRVARMTLLRGWILTDDAQVPGLSFHQAKGQEWPRVDVALDAESLAILAEGLDENMEDHRKLYVALTRGMVQTRLRAI
jgi:DNA helicase-2/ATP-dependent DNA helicase PcrA